MVSQTQPKSAGHEPETDTGSGRRLLRVLFAFNADTPLITAEELARRIGLPLSSTYRYLATLREAGLVADHGRRGFAAGSAAIRLAAAARAANPVERIGKPHIRQLMIDAGETVMVIRRLNLEATCVDGVETTRIIRVPVTIGSILPLHRDAGPMTLLAGLAEPLREHVLQQCASHDKLTAGSVAALRSELRVIADQGWAICDGAVFPDVFAVAAPIRDDERVVASLAVVAPAFRVSAATAVCLRDMVIARAAVISSELIQRGGPVAEAAE